MKTAWLLEFIFRCDFFISLLSMRGHTGVHPSDLSRGYEQGRIQIYTGREQNARCLNATHCVTTLLRNT